VEPLGALPAVVQQPPYQPRKLKTGEPWDAKSWGSFILEAKMKIGIVGARKYKDKKSVANLVSNLPSQATIITSSCKGVCTWAREASEERGIKLVVYTPDLENIRAWFEVPKRYYQRNKELVEACDLLHAFISAEDGFVGGTRFEVRYALSLGIGVYIHWENGVSRRRYPIPKPSHCEDLQFFLSWEEFFRNTDLSAGRAKCKVGGLIKLDGFWYDQKNFPGVTR